MAAVYQEIVPKATGTTKEWIFKSTEILETSNHHGKISWLTSVKILFPDKFQTVESTTVGKGILNQLKKKKVGKPKGTIGEH